MHARAGLMPESSRNGRFVAFNSAHIWGIGSQMYVAGGQQMKVGWPTAAVPAARDPPARSVTLVDILRACFRGHSMCITTRQIVTCLQKRWTSGGFHIGFDETLITDRPLCEVKRSLYDVDRLRGSIPSY